MNSNTQTTLEQLYRRENLDSKALEGLFARLVAGELDPVLLAALLVALKVKGESGSEIAAAARALRAAAKPFPRPDYVFADCCGTGGDGQATLNVSSGVALTAAACGLPIAKHGNGSVSSRSGSADVLAELGINVRADRETSRRCLDEVGVAFLFAPDYHPGIAHAMPVRKALATRTLFNVLGPLVNPARPPCQLVGVYAPELVRPIAEALLLLGVERALVVHGSGMDELALHGPTTAARVAGGAIQPLVLTPRDAGLDEQPLAALRGGAAADNASALAAVLAGGGRAAYRDAIAFNTGALLWVTGLADDAAAGTAQALAALADGSALARLGRCREVSHGA